MKIFRGHLDVKIEVLSILVSFPPPLFSIPFLSKLGKTIEQEGEREKLRMACLNVLKAEIKILESTFSKSHER